MSPVQARWSSKRAFILAVTGAAVGLGNIWRFPYIAGENGGALFFLLYVIFILIMGLPIMAAEILIGRAGRLPPLQALSQLAQANHHTKHWQLLGILGLVSVFLVLSFYSVVSGWALQYLLLAPQGQLSHLSASAISQVFNQFLADPYLVIRNHTLFMIMTMAVVAIGITKGLERLNNWLMPFLYLLLILLVVYAATTSGFVQTLNWLFTPNWQALNFSVVLAAMGHAFFTLAIGACALMTYGAYMPEKQSLPWAIGIVAFLDVLVAVLSGIAIFSVVFSHHLDPASGPGLMFVTLPVAFAHLPFGSVLLSAFFILLLVATWTSSINLAEPMVATLTQGRIKRPQAALFIGVLVWAMGLLSALSFSTLANFKPIGDKTFFELVTTFAPDVLLPLGGLLIAWFAVRVLAPQVAEQALATHVWLYRLWRFVSTYIAIPLVAIILLAALIGYL